PGQEPFPQRAKGHEADTQFFEHRKNFHFGLSPPERVFTLESGDRLNFVRAADGLHAGFRKAEMLDLALLNEVLYGARDVFNGHFWIDPVLVEKIDDAGFETLERFFGDFFDAGGVAIQSNVLAVDYLPSKLCSNNESIAERSKRFAD